MQIWHPDSPGTVDRPSVVSEHQFEICWKAKGWKPWPPKKEGRETPDEGFEAPTESEDE